ncbi:hypothetical protein [Marinicrinis sediminis]|uniref:Uncharacterized protein n=1 Tax=Marinicrinis sediminis TaxID=1652465 RepID=A0ABW5R6P7_9BACL
MRMLICLVLVLALTACSNESNIVIEEKIKENLQLETEKPKEKKGLSEHSIDLDISQVKFDADMKPDLKNKLLIYFKALKEADPKQAADIFYLDPEKSIGVLWMFDMQDITSIDAVEIDASRKLPDDFLGEHGLASESILPAIVTVVHYTKSNHSYSLNFIFVQSENEWKLFRVD